MKKLTMDYVTPCLINKMSKRKENPQGENAAMMLQQNKNDNSFMYQSAKSCFYCGKPGHIAQFCYKAKIRKRKNANNVKHKDEFALCFALVLYIIFCISFFIGFCISFLHQSFILVLCIGFCVRLYASVLHECFALIFYTRICISVLH